MTRKYSSISNATTLTSSVSSGDTTLSVASATSLIPVTVNAGDQYTLAIEPDTNNEEIVFVYSASANPVDTNNLTVLRGQAGSTAKAHATGSTVKHVLSGDDLTFYTTGVATANAAVPSSVVTAKADILVAASNGVVDNLPVGTNNQILTADSSQTLGLKWATPAMTFISNTTFTSVTSVSVNNCFSNVYDAYLITFYSPSATAVNMLMRASGTNSVSGYSDAKIFSTNATSSAATRVAQTDGFQPFGTGGLVGNVAQLTITNPALALPTYYSASPVYREEIGLYGVTMASGRHSVSTAYDGFTLTFGNVSATGWVKVYGLRNS